MMGYDFTAISELLDKRISIHVLHADIRSAMHLLSNTPTGLVGDDVIGQVWGVLHTCLDLTHSIVSNNKAEQV